MLVPAVLWPCFAVVAYRAIRAGDVVRHREWMTRLYAVTFFALTARMVTPLLLLVQVPIMQSRYDGDVQAAVSASIPYGQWLGWIINLLIAQLDHPPLAHPPRDRTHLTTPSRQLPSECALSRQSLTTRRDFDALCADSARFRRLFAPTRRQGRATRPISETEARTLWRGTIRTV